MTHDTDLDPDAAFVAEGSLLRFPALDALGPIARLTTQERVEERLAFYEAIYDQIDEGPLPHATDVRIHPREEGLLRRWVEAPAAEEPSEEATDYNRLRAWTEWPIRRAARGTRGLYRFWPDKGSSISPHVPDGQIIATAPAYPERAP